MFCLRFVEMGRARYRAPGDATGELPAAVGAKSSRARSSRRLGSRRHQVDDLGAEQRESHPVRFGHRVLVLPLPGERQHPVEPAVDTVGHQMTDEFLDPLGCGGRPSLKLPTSVTMIGYSSMYRPTVRSHSAVRRRRSKCGRWRNDGSRTGGWVARAGRRPAPADRRQPPDRTTTTSRSCRGPGHRRSRVPPSRIARSPRWPRATRPR